MTGDIFAVPCSALGRLSVMPCPAPDRLEQAVCDLKDQGVTVVLSMLRQDETHQLGVEREADLCTAQGLRFMSFSITDFGLPDLGEFGDLIQRLIAQLRAGEHIVVKCRAGIGRSGMVAACILISLGQSAAEAIETVSQARGVSIPDTVEQGRFIAAYAETVAYA